MTKDLSELQVNSILEITRKGLPVTRLNDYYLHSKYDPLKEAETFVNTHYQHNFLHVLFGYGNGYIVNQFQTRMTKHDFLLVIEPNESHYKAQNVKNIKNNITIFVGDSLDQLKQIFCELCPNFVRRTKIVLSPNYDKVYPTIYRTTLQLLKEISHNEQVQINTLKRFSRIWQKNVIFNLFDSFQATPVKKLEKKFSIPIVVVSAGPSLTKQLPLLKEVSNQCMIICAGSAINSLLNYGIRPHAVVAIDGGEYNYLHFKDTAIDDVVMFYPLSVYHKIVEKHKGHKVLFSIHTHSIAPLVNRLLQTDVGMVDAGASVANFCVYIAHQISEGSICLIGQDLAYTNKQSHAEHNIGKKDLDAENEKELHTFFADGYYGDRVLTDHSFISMKIAFEKFIDKIIDKERLFNCTEGGLRIEGYSQLPFAEYVEKYCSEKISSTLDVVLNDYKVQRTKSEWSIFRQKIDKEIKNLADTKDVCKKGLGLIKKSAQTNPINQGIFRKLHEVDKHITKALKSDFMVYRTEDIIYRMNTDFLQEENETKEKELMRILDQSRMLYTDLFEAITETMNDGMLLIQRIDAKINSF